MESNIVEYDKVPSLITDSIHALNDWGYAIIVISGKVIVISGEIQMADVFQSIDEHFIDGKDITGYLMNNSVNLAKAQQREAFDFYLNELKSRNYRLHKDERYLRYSRE